MQNHKKHTSIKARILRLGIINIIVAMTSLTAVSTLLIATILNNLFTEEGTALISSYSSMFNNTLSTLKQDIEQFAEDTAMVDERKTIAERKAYLNTLAGHTIYKDFSIAYEDGTTYNDTDISDRVYFQEALKGHTYVSSPVIRKTDGSTVIMVGTPVKVDGFKGILYGAIDATILSAGFSDIKYGSDSDVFVVNSDSQIVAAINAEGVEQLSQLKDSTLLSCLTEDSGTIHHDDYLVSYSRLALSDDWYLIIRMHMSFVTGVLLQCVAVTIACGLLLLAIDIVVCKNVANKLSMPIKQVTTRLISLAAGDIHSSIEISFRGDETEDLVKSLHTTLANMKLYIDDTSDRLESLAGGDLTASTDVQYAGDFKKLKSALDDFQDHLRSSFGQIVNAVDSVHQGASQISDGAQHLSEISITQASSAGA